MSDYLKEAGINIIDKAAVDQLFAVKNDEGTDVELHRAQAGVLGGFAESKVMGVPIGAAAVGLLVVSVWDAIRGLVGGKLPTNIPQWVIPAIGAMVIQSKFIKPRIGDAAANAAGLILTVDAIQALFNVRGIVGGLVNKAPVKLQQTMRGPTQPTEVTSIAAYNAMMGIT